MELPENQFQEEDCLLKIDMSLKKKRRQNLGRNIGGQTYSSDVNPNYNPRERTFKEFLEIIQGLV